MESPMTEATGRIVYDPSGPSVFTLSDDLLEARLGASVYVRVGNKRYRIKALNTLVGDDFIELECEETF